MKITLKPRTNAPIGDLLMNIHASRDYPKVTWGVMRYPVCAVVGGGHSLNKNLDILRDWKGDIFAVNDTASFLSDQGIPSYIYAIDATAVPYKKGKLIKGALYASRVHPVQFHYKATRVFDMASDVGSGGVYGGVSAVNISCHLHLRMGYSGIAFFGCDGSFPTGTTHVSGTQKVAYDDMIIVRTGNKEFLTNAALLLQSEYLGEKIRKHPQFLLNVSEGLLEAMIETPDYDVVAIGEDLKNKYEELGCFAWNKEYKPEDDKLCQQPQPN